MNTTLDYSVAKLFSEKRRRRSLQRVNSGFSFMSSLWSNLNLQKTVRILGTSTLEIFSWMRQEISKLHVSAPGQDRSATTAEPFYNNNVDSCLLRTSNVWSSERWTIRPTLNHKYSLSDLWSWVRPLCKHSMTCTKWGKGSSRRIFSILVWANFSMIRLIQKFLERWSAICFRSSP
jgi:hypothetical protein